MKINWSRAAYQADKMGTAYVIATLIGVTGSTPRNSGTKMVITEDGIFDTIGGGHLEHKVIKRSNELLKKEKSCQEMEHFQLGIHLDQCCGGSANILFECFEETCANIMLFGAGHVGQALLPILASLPCKISWVDSRLDQFPEELSVFDNVEIIVNKNPLEAVASMPKNSYFIVMTHKHQMDFDICVEVLKRNDHQYLGLIGSKTKWRRFVRRFIKNGITEKQLKQMSCPIGFNASAGKLPAEIAVSIASEVISKYSEEKSENKKTRSEGVSRQIISELMK
jgi:xanthine dehydrogenase accessory factor